MTEKNEIHKEITWDELKIGGNYLKFETGVRTKLQLKNWRLVEREGKKYDSDEKEMKIFFESDVVMQDDKEVDIILSTSSNPFLKAAKPIFMDKNPEEGIVVTVKKLGDRSTTTYDIEVIN